MSGANAQITNGLFGGQNPPALASINPAGINPAMNAGQINPLFAQTAMGLAALGQYNP